MEEGFAPSAKELLLNLLLDANPGLKVKASDFKVLSFKQREVSELLPLPELPPNATPAQTTTWKRKLKATETKNAKLGKGDDLSTVAEIMAQGQRTTITYKRMRLSDHLRTVSETSIPLWNNPPDYWNDEDRGTYIIDLVADTFGVPFDQVDVGFKTISLKDYLALTKLTIRSPVNGTIMFVAEESTYEIVVEFYENIHLKKAKE